MRRTKQSRLAKLRSVQFREGLPRPGEPRRCLCCNGLILASDSWLLISEPGAASLATHEHCRAFAPSVRDELRQTRASFITSQALAHA